MVRSRPPLGLMAVLPLVFAASATPSRASLLINYDSSVTPDDPSQDFAADTAGSGAWYAAGGELHIAVDAGSNDCAFFGTCNSLVPACDSTSWDIPPDDIGTYLRVRTRLAPGSTHWVLYVVDGQYGAGWILDETAVSWAGPGSDTLQLDTTVYHDYEVFLGSGRAGLWIDHQLAYLGPTWTDGYRRSLIGDTDCRGGAGTGEMVIDHVTYMSGDLGPPVIPSVSVEESLASRRWGVVKSLYR